MASLTSSPPKIIKTKTRIVCLLPWICLWEFFFYNVPENDYLGVFFAHWRLRELLLWASGPGFMARLLCDILENIFSDSWACYKTLRAMALKSPGSFHKEFDMTLYKNKLNIWTLSWHYISSTGQFLMIPVILVNYFLEREDSLEEGKHKEGLS